MQLWGARMCPFCRGTMRIVGSGGLLNTYCIDCGEVVVTAADDADSYFEWLMSMPKSKRSEASPSNPSR
jgi:hypothetical protein